MHKVSLDLKGYRDCLELLELPVPLVRKDRLEILEFKEVRVPRVYRVLLDHQDHRDQLVNLVYQETLAVLVPLDPLDGQVSKGLKVMPDRLVKLAQLDLLVQLDSQVCKEQLVHQEQEDNKVQQA